jgi:hypothetical protein
VGLGYRQQWRSRLGILMLCLSLNKAALGYPRHLEAYPEEIIDILIICLELDKNDIISILRQRLFVEI